MQQHIVPTSPKSPLRPEKAVAHTRDTSSHILFIAVISSIIVGVVSGFFGFIIAFTIPAEWPLIGSLTISSVFQDNQNDLLLSSARPLDAIVTTQNPQVIDQIVTLYSTPPALGAESSFIGNGVILTSDGWMVASSVVLSGIQNPIVVLPDGSTAEVVQRADDEYTQLTYFRVSSVNLPVVSFETEMMDGVGRSVSVIEKNAGSFSVYDHRIAGVANSDAVRSTGSLSFLPLLDMDGLDHRVGSPVFLSNGLLFGILGANSRVAPAYLIAASLPTVVATGVVERTLHDITYVNVAAVTKELKEANGFPEDGAYIHTVGAEETEGLRPGDVVLSVDNALVQSQTDFAAMLFSKAPGSVLGMTILREGAEQTVQYTW